MPPEPGARERDEEAAEPRPESPTAGWRRLLAVLARFVPLLGPVLLLITIGVLHRELAHFRYRDIAHFIRSLPPSRLALALALTVAAYLTLTGYDALSLFILRRRMPYPRVALAAFLGYAFSNTAGHSLLTGTPLRFRLYSAWGLANEEIARLVSLNFLTFWLGFLSLTGTVLTFVPEDLPPSFPLPIETTRPLGLVFLALAIAYLVAAVVRRRPIVVRGWELPLPRPGFAIAQIAISALDWSLSAAVLHSLLPAASAPPFAGFLGLFLLAQIAGLLSQVPGGLGVFDSLIVVMLAPTVSAPAALASLLAYRFLYYLLPLVCAALLLAGYEIAAHRQAMGRAARTLGAWAKTGGLWASAGGRWASSLVPVVLALTTFVAGAILLFSGATPAVGSRLAWLSRLLPLPLIEVSHWLGSLVGAALLILAQGLRRRLDAAFHLTAILLGVGIVASLAKGLDWEEALLLGAMLLALLACRDEFHRKASLLGMALSPGWVFAVVVVLGGSVWLGLFAFKHVEFSQELWWRFALRGDAPRFLRATVGAVGLALVYAFARLLRAAPAGPRVTSPQELATVTRLTLHAPRTYAQLALLGDKRFLVARGDDAFLMYGLSGRCWVAMGDPVGPPEPAQELAWSFVELAAEHGGWPVFYQVGDRELSRYVDLGLELAKLGEEARVPLAGFSLAGKGRSDLRQALRRGERDGCRFEVIPAERVGELLPALAAVSDEWLAEKGTREKGFSLGCFAPDYLRQTPVAVLWREERLVAFANLWLGGDRAEISVDLMRFSTAAPHGAMDLLFTHLLLWGAEQGFAAFNLGMAPLSGLAPPGGLSPVGSLWSRIGTQVYRHGEHFYNFQGLRRYKEKFDPVWEPRYLAWPGRFRLPRVLTAVAALIGGGITGVVRK